MGNNQQIQLAFYGDDFTGSTDALEFICKAGAKAVLFIEAPATSQIQRFGQLDAIGVAGKTRSLSSEDIVTVLENAFKTLSDLDARHLHYKVCSTFDSSPTIGSIGTVLDTASIIFTNRPIPILGGTPSLGRYCAFGNLFAKMGIGSSGAVYRLDRHPSMSQHPVTPADESDLRFHLQKQTNKAIGLIDIVELQKPVQDWNEVTGEDSVLIDAIYEEQLIKIGEWLEQQSSKHDGSYFSIGSSAIEMALGFYWNKIGQLQKKVDWLKPGKAEPLLVVSGSCSPVTAAQIAWAKRNGFEELVIDAAGICNNESPEKVFDKVNDLLRQQKNMIVHTGPKQANNLSSEKLGNALGTIARNAVMDCSIKRVVVAGGDTSSYAARAMEIEAVEMIAPLVSGAPLCKAYSHNEWIDGLEVNFKGGQVGAEDYFGVLLEGRMRSE
ncbi:four-carbon acid sugar kinase family protein [Niabella ginsengisoli]|uniref:Four-carbon acid sugar kinase family protein n=1 Tax=Niabella ginsengisoli TaxID=522298 RepID=A0ABS9SHI9_9BACT|nr:four-carbon acid sugar kinase family protein [Niabella ginsengisoli]MCH5597841.1 four-carbon acid sugar kinase family protein [Niabella ginsengisoli]